MDHAQQPLTPDERIAMRAFLREQRLYMRIELVFLSLGLLAVVVLLLSASGAWMPLALLMLLGGLGLWRAPRLLTHRRELRPIRDALTGGMKTVTCGALQAVSAVQPDRVLYRIAGGSLTLRLLGGFDLGSPGMRIGHVEQRQIHALAHMAAPSVTAHWLQADDGQGFVLRVDYAGEPQAASAATVADAAAIDRAAGELRSSMRWMMGVLALLWGVTSALNGFSPSVALQSLAILGGAAGIMLLGVRLWPRRVADRQPDMDVLTGAISEILVFENTRPGRSATRNREHWYRIGGVLLRAGPTWPGTLRIGQVLRLELLHGEGSGGTRFSSPPTLIGDAEIRSVQTVVD